MKKIATLLGFFAITMSMAVTVYAYTSTGSQKGPEAYSGVTTRSSTYNLTTTAQTVKGSATGVYFTNLGWLRNISVPSSSRHAYIYLMEEDFTGGDDQAKFYDGTFSGRNLTNIIVHTVNNSGDIEAAGDNRGEFYLTLELSPIAGDVAGSNGEIFYFEIRLN